MGHKKRPPASNRKSETPPSTAAAIKEGIKREYERALTALQRGNHSKALRIIKESTPKFGDSALFHRIAGKISVKVSTIIDDITGKRKHLKQALESAKKASKLSPNSLVHAQSYANILLRQSQEKAEFEEVVAECERALAIEKPIDPSFDKFGSVTDYSAEAMQGRVARIQSDLRSILAQANMLLRQRIVDEPHRARVAAITRLLEYTKIEERNANANAGTLSERKDHVRSFWNSMSFEMKRGFFKIKVSDLRAYLESLSSKDGGQAVRLFSEALEFRIMNHTWKFSACCRCGERFADETDATDHLDHVIHTHLDNQLPLKLQSVLPQSVDSEWEEMLISGSWEPLDLTAWGRMLEDEAKSRVYELSSKEALKWETSDDTERAKLLRKISSLFQALLRQKCLAMSHLQVVIRYTVKEFQGLYPGSLILSCGVEQTPRCICFLGASSLEFIVDFLQEVSHSTGYGTCPKGVSVDDTSACQSNSDGEDVTLDESASFLQVNEISLKCDSAGIDIMGSGNSVGGQSDFGMFWSWLYTGSHWAEQLATYSITQIERSREGAQLLETLDKEFTQLRSLCEKKEELLEHQEALQEMEELFLEEFKKREQMRDIFYCSYESILRKRRREIASNRSKLEAISNLLKGAATIRGNEDSYDVISSHRNHLEADEEDQDRKLNQRRDNCIEAALQMQKENMNLEIWKLDVTIMYKVDDMNKVKAELQQVSVFDYRFIVMPLVKSFMKARLENLAEKYTQKSDAAREAFLAELVTKGL